MKKSIAIIGWIVEVAILVGLAWKHFDLYDPEIAFLLILLSPLFAVGHWLALKKEHKENHLRQAIRLKLFFLTGPMIILCLSLILSINYELNRVRLVGGATKEMELSLIKEGYPDDFQQWTKYSVKKMKSDQVLYVMLLVSACLLYGNRCFLGKQNAIDDVSILKTSETADINKSA